MKWAIAKEAAAATGNSVLQAFPCAGFLWSHICMSPSWGHCEMADDSWLSWGGGSVGRKGKQRETRGLRFTTQKVTEREPTHSRTWCQEMCSDVPNSDSQIY